MGRVVIQDVSTLVINPNDFNPDFAPGELLSLIIAGEGTTITDTDLLYIIDVGSSSRTEDRSMLYDPVRGSGDIFINASSFLTSTDYMNALYHQGMSPRMHWSLADGANLVSNAVSSFALTQNDMTVVTDDGPMHEGASMQLSADASNGASNNFSNALAQLFNNRADGDKQLRGALAIWFHPYKGFSANQQTIFSVADWLTIKENADGTITGLFGPSNYAVQSTATLVDGWNLLVLSYTGADADFNIPADPDVTAGELKLYLNGYNSTANVIPTIDSYPSSITIGAAKGHYGQATIFIEPVTASFVSELWETGLRDGAEVIDVVQQTGNTVGVIYPWYNQAISVLANNTIATTSIVNQPIGDAPEAQDPASGLND